MTMSSLINNLRKRGLKAELMRSTRAMTPKEKALAQGEKMLAKIDGFTKPEDFDEHATAATWWSKRARGNTRKVCIKYDSRVIPNTNDYPENTLEAVRHVITQMVEAIRETPDSDFEAEAARRKAVKQ